jgi:trans-2-enoyl-CoA reductase
MSRTLPAALRTTSRHILRPRYTPQSLQSRRHISAYGYEQAKALVYTKHGEPAEVLSLHTHSISPAHSNLLTIRFLASPINPADYNQLQGVYPSKPTFSRDLGTPEPVAIGGNEGVAEVIAVGDKVTNLKKGDWVIMRNPGFGTWRTHAQVTEDHLLKIEDKQGITPAQAGTVSVNPCTAYRMLKEFVNLKEGDWFIQNGANSAVGMMVIQLAKLWGLRSINVIRDRDQGLDELKRKLTDLGADVVVTTSEMQSRDIVESIKAWTNDAPIRLGLNCVGGKLVTSMAKVMSSGAHLVTYGAMAKQPTLLPAGLLIFKDIHFDGFWVSKWSEENPEEKKKTVHHVLQLYREGKLKSAPVDEINWDWDTKGDTLTEAVKGTLEGYRKGKGVFVFGKT